MKFDIIREDEDGTLKKDNEEFSNIDALLDFIEEEGECIITPPFNHEIAWNIRVLPVIGTKIDEYGL